MTPPANVSAPSFEKVASIAPAKDAHIHTKANNAKHRLIRGSLVLGLGQGVALALSFARNIVLARLLTQTDFGIAAIFALTASLVDMASNMAVDKLLIQSKHGDQTKFQSVIQAFEVARGFLLGAILLVFASGFAGLFGVPEATWAFQLLAAAPVVRGFRHLDITRVQRSHNFSPQSATEVCTSVIALAMIWPLVVWTGDYSAALWVILIREVLKTALSHLLAERRYTLSWDPTTGREVMRFGWPLALNGLLMFGALQADRMVVGVGYSIDDLALYAAASLLTITPVLAIGRFYSVFALPSLAKGRESVNEFQNFYRTSFGLLSMISFVFAGCIAIYGDALMRLIYGTAYGNVGLTLTLLGASAGVRLIRTVPTTAAIGIGETKLPMYANVIRLSGLCIAIALAYCGIPLWTIAAANLFGEVLALLWITLEFKRRSGGEAGENDYSLIRMDDTS